MQPFVLFPDTHADLLDWTTKMINSVRMAVETIKVKIYPGSWKGTRVRLHLDIEEGLKLYTGDDKVMCRFFIRCFSLVSLKTPLYQGYPFIYKTSMKLSRRCFGIINFLNSVARQTMARRS